jgi:glucosamine--fructose-6-phosphate aminotransferase (isomerizing)
MCGIIALSARPSTRPAPSGADILARLDAAVICASDASGSATSRDIVGATAHVSTVNELLKGVPGVMALAGNLELIAAIEARLARLDELIASADVALESANLDPERLEVAAGELIAVRDAVWSVGRDRLRTARSVAELAGRDAGVPALSGYLMIQQAFAAIDRMEVRGRDSAGIHVFVWGHGLQESDLRGALDERAIDPLFQSGSVRWIDGVLSFVYKAAAEIGELGDNTKVMRAAVQSDALLRRALSHPGARTSLVGHTRWASVGIISEPNAHPVNSERSLADVERPYVIAALNGDVDNHADLRIAHGLSFPGQITTDAKVIPALVTKHRQDCGDTVEAFRRSVASFEGSVAIAAAATDDPERLLLALHGSGQGLFVGLAEDLFIVASEPYGVVEETNRYFRLDGEGVGAGQIVILDGRRSGELDGVVRLGYDGTAIPVDERSVITAEVTTRDIDRGDSPHFLLKEIGEAPESFRKTLRGKITEIDGRLTATIGARSLPDDIRRRLADGTIDKVRVIGQGTAAIAGRSCASVLDELCDGELDVDPITATELSGFNLRLDMSDTLIVAVSQSGTTTDTNRTVDLARGRGAAVIAIVNRRGSDLCEKSDGVLFTSDGRDVEMSVASTKAFYAQVAAGVLLACAISEAAGVGSDQRRHDLLAALRTVPDAMRAVIARRGVIAEIARRYAPSKRYWAVVGNGPNAIAANEVRIKLSELCYKSISCDVTEDKKHIDLSCEPLILVCASGLVGSTADDVAKEIAIYRAHKATPIVVANESESRFDAAHAVIAVPDIDSSLAFILSAMAGHLFGYEAALAIDELARPLREAREIVEHAVVSRAEADQVVSAVRSGVRPMAERFQEVLRSGAYDGHLEASTAVRVATMLRVILDSSPIEAHQNETGKVGSPSALIDDLTLALTRAIEELTRPVDAIKHQAKTVTVGISRSDEGIMDRALVREVLATGAGRDVLSYRTLKVLADLDPAVEAVVGFTRYAIEGDPTTSHASIAIVDRGGLSRDVPSRVDRNPSLVGTKRRVANEREVLVARGRGDGRTVIFVPEVKSGQTVGITLVHVRFHDHLPAAVIRTVLQGYDRRYDRLVDWVSETEGEMRDDLLAEIPVADLLILPISDMADRWRRPA